MDLEESSETLKIFEDLNRNRNLIVATNGQNHERVMMELYSQASKRFKKVCIITMDKPFGVLVKRIQDEGIDTRGFSAIDCTTTKKKEPSTQSSTIYITSPSSLTELSVALEKRMKRDKTELIILDNISTLLLYNQDVMVLKFLHSMMIKLRENNGRGIYMILKERGSEVLPALALFADEVLEA